MSQNEVVQTLRATLDLLHPDRMVEIRALGVRRGHGTATASGYFLDHNLAAQEAAKLDTRGADGIYVITGEIHPGAYARAPERIIFGPAHTTTDRDVIARHWLLVDADPIRPSGISSTAAELAVAEDVIGQIRDWFLDSIFFSSLMVLALSGNGYHLLVNLQDRCEQYEVERMLGNLQRNFAEGTGVSIDQKVAKLAQLTKLYGTLARKGFALKDRPHRRSQIKEIWRNGICTQVASVDAEAESSGVSGEPGSGDPADQE